MKKSEQQGDVRIRLWPKTVRLTLNPRIDFLADTSQVHRNFVLIFAMKTLSENHVIYEDNHLLVVNKPAGWLSQSDGSSATDVLTQAKSYIKEKYNKPGSVYLGLVHRLDRNVSGVMILARTSKAASRISECIRDHKMQKIYLALIDGKSENSKGRLSDYLIKDATNKISRQVSKNHENAQRAELEYKVIANYSSKQLKLKNHTKNITKQFSLIRVKLITGRFHQIRIQMALNLAPIVGDRKYKSTTSLNGIPLCLHCCNLKIPHPVKGDFIEFDSPLPKSWGL